MLKDSLAGKTGFTLIELLIAMTISMLILTSLGSVFLTQLRTYDLQEQLVEMNQNARAALDFMTREIRMAGFGVPQTNLSNWVDWVSGVTMNSSIVIENGTGAQGSDIVHVAGCFDDATSSLVSGASAGDTSLEVQSGDGSEFNTGSKKVISLNGLENAVVTAVSGDTLTIDTDPGTSGTLEGLNQNFLSGDPIYILKVISYSIVLDADGSSILKRNENLGAGRQPLIENITDLQISQSGGRIEINPLEAQTDQPDPEYAINNGFRIKQLRSIVSPPNLML